METSTKAGEPALYPEHTSLLRSHFHAPAFVSTAVNGRLRAYPGPVWWVRDSNSPASGLEAASSPVIPSLELGFSSVKWEHPHHMAES